MKKLLLAAAFVALMPATSAFAWCGSGVGYNCNINDPTFNNSNTFKPKNTFDPTVNTKAYGGAGGGGGAGGAGGQGGTGGNGYGGSANQKQHQNQDQSQQQYSTQANSQSNTFQAAASSAVVNGAALAGLAASECVLSDTQTVGGALQVMTFGASAVEGTGKTKPYDECNARAAAPYVAAIAMNHGKIRNDKHPNGVDAELVYENLVSGLTGVEAAMDKADPSAAPQTSSAAPAVAVIQTAALDTSEPPRCANDNAPMATKLALGCR